MLSSWRVFDLSKVARKERVDQGVGTPPVEDEIGAQVPFPPEADALQNALRRNVVRFNERLDTRKPGLGQRPASEERDCTRGEAAAASALDQPVALNCAADLNCARLPLERQDNRTERLARACISDRERQSFALVGSSPLAFESMRDPWPP